jgi:hypothetical protein
MDIRMMETEVIKRHVGQYGYVDLFGSFDGQDFMLKDQGEWQHSFRSGLKLPEPEARLQWQLSWNCNTSCAGAAR